MSTDEQCNFPDNQTSVFWQFPPQGQTLLKELMYP